MRTRQALNAGIVVFPGSNCEHDVALALNSVNVTTQFVWHQSCSLDGLDLVVLPGGFAHGDYLRPGAIARFSPIMKALVDFIDNGGVVLGICNGFQILTEAGLLPGALCKNKGLKFLCQNTKVRVCSNISPFTANLPIGTELDLPINHFSGNYICDTDTLNELESHGQIVLKYVANPNGSLHDIAGITNLDGNVMGLMPHPERACDELCSITDGMVLLNSLVHSLDS
ncbi:MAG: phosphoribosylformylglycinamidine synthase subunit PurQ [Actinobacteria bacterium]|nr:phosphoribosylformylglycinamidine synthase subunit PurQ [Actinomycetota bacterium]MCL6104029.1 phosphoribosylformylglycinamidine synthase subunit PurQ [Actinomycetota bacterium]